MRDFGLFVSMLEDGTQYDILQDNLFGYKGECTLVEVKVNTENAQSTKTILHHPEKYHVYSAVKLGNYNVGRSGQILTLPLYMAFLLREF